MLRAALFISSLFITFQSFSQEWHTYKVDSSVSVVIPDNYTTIDSLSFVISKLDSGSGIMIYMVKLEKNSSGANDEEHLIASYKSFVQGVQQSTKAENIEEKVIEKDGLRYLDFSYEVTGNDGLKKLFYSRLLLLNGVAYSFTFYELPSQYEELSELRKKFFLSIKVPDGVTLDNQLSDWDHSYTIGYGIGYWGSLILLLMVAFSIVGGLGALVYWLVKGRK